MNDALWTPHQIKCYQVCFGEQLHVILPIQIVDHHPSSDLLHYTAVWNTTEAGLWSNSLFLCLGRFSLSEMTRKYRSSRSHDKSWSNSLNATSFLISFRVHRTILYRRKGDNAVPQFLAVAIFKVPISCSFSGSYLYFVFLLERVYML